MHYKITALNIFPVKSLSGFSPLTARAGERGFHLDRQWMIVDEDNRCITQREYPWMSLLGVSVQSEGIELSSKNDPEDKVLVPFDSDRKPATVMIWNDTCAAEKYTSPRISEWLSEKIGAKCGLVYAPAEMKRAVDPRYSPLEIHTGFPDGFPYLLANTASLTDMNEKSGEAFEMIRFRPNIVFEGDQPFQEDTWKKIKIGEVVFHVVKPCERCVMINVDPGTGKKGKEPLKTLASYRRHNNRILFAQNMIAENDGEISTGDFLEVLELKS